MEESRKKKEDENVDVSKIEEIFREIFFSSYKSHLFFPDIIEDEPFYNLIKHFILEESKNREKNFTPLSQFRFNCDIAFIFYIKDFYHLMNYKYLHFFIKFIVLFRQGLNILKSPEKSPKITCYYTQTNDCKGVPEININFITEFMHKKNYFGMDIIELLEIKNHFFYWLHIKKYTPTDYFYDKFCYSI